MEKDDKDLDELLIQASAETVQNLMEIKKKIADIRKEEKLYYEIPQKLSVGVHCVNVCGVMVDIFTGNVSMNSIYRILMTQTAVMATSFFYTNKMKKDMPTFKKLNKQINDNMANYQKVVIKKYNKDKNINMNVDDLSDKEKQQKYNEIIFRSYVQKIVDKKLEEEPIEDAKVKKIGPKKDNNKH